MYNSKTPNTRTPQSGLIPVRYFNPNVPHIFNPNMPHIFNPYITPDNRYKPSGNNILFNRSQPSNNLLDTSVNHLVQNNTINESELQLPSDFNYSNVFEKKSNETPTIIDVSKNKDDSKEDSKNKDDSKEDSKNKNSSKTYLILLEDEVFSKKNILNFIDNLPEIIKENINIINLNKDIKNDDYMNKFKDIRVDIFRIILNSFIQLKDSIENHNDDLDKIFDYMLEVDYYTETKVDFEKIFKEVKSDDEVLALNLKMEDYNHYMKKIVKKKWNTKKQLKCFLTIPENTSSPDKRKRKVTSLNNKFENSKPDNMDSKSNNKSYDEGYKPKKLTIKKRQKVSESNTDIQQNDDDVLDIEKYLEKKRIAKKDSYEYRMEKKKQIKELKNELLKTNNELLKTKNENQKLRENIKQLKSILDDSFL